MAYCVHTIDIAVVRAADVALQLPPIPGRAESGLVLEKKSNDSKTQERPGQHVSIEPKSVVERRPA